MGSNPTLSANLKYPMFMRVPVGLTLVAALCYAESVICRRRA